MSRSRITGVHSCDDTAQVLTVVKPSDGPYAYRRQPCAECPWRMDRPRRAFPVEAYRHSAACAYDMAPTTFACHMSGTGNPATCAGFLLSRDAAHNLQVRLKAARGLYDWRTVTAAGLKLYPSYTAMAIANGVRRDDPAIQPCRSEG